MRHHVAVAARLLAVIGWLGAVGCAGDDFVWLGEFESPCESSDDCLTGLCLQVDGHGSCTQNCARGCPAPYVCVSDVCAPQPSPALCQVEHARCGESFPACCGGTSCVDWPDWGPRCSRVGCATASGCWSECCQPAGGSTVCAPPSYCR